MKVARNFWYTNAIKNCYTGQHPSRLLCGCTSYCSNQKQTKYGNIYPKWYKYTVPKWKIKVLKRWLVQSSSHWIRILLQDNPNVQVCWHWTNQCLVNRYKKPGTCSKSTSNVSESCKRNDTDGVWWWSWTDYYIVETYAMTSEY